MLLSGQPGLSRSQWANGNAGVEYTGTQEWMNWLDQNDISWANWSAMNKEKSSSIFEPGTETLSESGEYLKSILGDYATTGCQCLHDGELVHAREHERRLPELDPPIVGAIGLQLDAIAGAPLLLT